MIRGVDISANPTVRLDRRRRRSGRLVGAPEGASSVEYALILVAIAIGSIVLIAAFVRVAQSSYDRTCAKVGGGGASSAPAACG